MQQVDLLEEINKAAGGLTEKNKLNSSWTYRNK